VLRNPGENELARCIGMLDAADAERVHDVAVVGAGPAGLRDRGLRGLRSLSVLVIDARAFGGQAGASARIENYLGFPTAFSGQALAGRAYTQAQKFGARMLIPAEAVRLDCGRPEERDPLALELAGTRSVRSRTVVVATGARYRRPDCADLKALEGRGVWYWASPIEAKACAGQEVALVGGGNSAGQAAVFSPGMSPRCGCWCAARGSREHVEISDRPHRRDPQHRIAHADEIVCARVLARVRVESLAMAAPRLGRRGVPRVRNVFLVPRRRSGDGVAEGLRRRLRRQGLRQHGAGGRLPLETNVPGVVRDRRRALGSVKRVGGAIGEGARWSRRSTRFWRGRMPRWRLGPRSAW